MASQQDKAISSYHYHVFLSFRGEDTRKTFTDHLYTALVNAGFRTFRDDDGIERGENVTSELHNAIRQSRSSIIVFSKDYASSRWCLDELCLILECRRAVKHVVLPVFYNVDPSEVRKQTGIFAKAFQRHERRYSKFEVKKWRDALGEAADLAGMVLQNQEDGHESKFIQKIVRVIGGKLHQSSTILPPNLIGINCRAESLNHWIRNQSSNTSIAAICGMGGIGKTTLAKFVYETNKGYFDAHCFLEDIRDTSKRSNGIIHLQKKLLSNILKFKNENIRSVDEGILEIQDALCYKRILLILDDVDHIDQINAIIGMRKLFHPETRIIITTRQEYLLRARESYNLQESRFRNVHNVKLLDDDESLKLFCLYAFGQEYPPGEDYGTESRRIVKYCGGLPLALIVVGRSLRGKSSPEVWRSTADKMREIPNNQVMEKLKISYESLEDDHDKSLFLYIVCFFVGRDRDKAIQRLDACQFYTVVGVDNLIDHCLLSVDHKNKLRMHQLIRDMGREIVRLESPKDPGERSLLWNRKDSLEVIREKSGTRKIEGFILDMDIVSENNYSSCENSQDDSDSISSIENSTEFEVDAFTAMKRLKILCLKHVELTGSYETFPKSLRWLSWKGFSHESLSNSLSLEGVVAIDMRHSSLKQLWTQNKLMGSLKILDLSHSQCLASTPDFSLLPKLERLVLKYCTDLVEIHESIGCLRKLILLNLKECKNLENLPNSIIKLKFLETLDISGCSNIKHLVDIKKLESLKVFLADGLAITQLISPSDASSNDSDMNISSKILIKLRQNPEISWAACLPSTLVSLSLSYCSLSYENFPKDLSHLSSLKKLNLSGNPFNILPEFIKNLKIDDLDLESCGNLEFVEGLRRPKSLNITRCRSLKKTTYYKESERSREYKVFRHNGTCPSLVEAEGSFKLEPLDCVSAELIEGLGMNNLKVPENMQMVMGSGYWGACSLYPIQGLYQDGTFNVFMPGEEVPSWFSHIREEGSVVSLSVPAIPPNLIVGGLNICVIYSFTYYTEEDQSPSNDSQRYKKALNREYGFQAVKLEVVIKRRKRLMKWSISPTCFGVPKGDDEHMTWLCHLSFEQPDRLEAGDKLSVSVLGRGQFHVTKCGASLVYYNKQASFDSCTISEIGEPVHDSNGGDWYYSNSWFELGVIFHPFDPSDSEEITGELR